MKDETTKKIKRLISPADSRLYLAIGFIGLISTIIIQKSPGVQQFIGGLAISWLLLMVFWRDIKRYNPDYLGKGHMLILLGIVFTGSLGLLWLAEYTLTGLSIGLELNAGDAIRYGLPIPAGAMLITLLFDFHTAIIFSLIISMLTGVWHADASFTIYAFVGSLTAAFSTIRCKKRTAILKAGGYVMGINVITVFTLLLFQGNAFTLEAPMHMAFAAAASIIMVAIVSLALPILEYLFKVSTDISLLELMDLEHPLLKQLMINAPGTYNHSIILGNLVEACAEDVGINPLLARVGAYYHDVGKVQMPEYFIENQSTGVNKHESLQPHMSSMILISHVKEGVDLAKKHKLPESVIDIIQQHHGSATIKFFYEKAKVLQGNEDLSREEYRYPGPKPQSRISALIMMADAVEAASKVLIEPNPIRISALVDKIINYIYLEGQLDECELTLKDIVEIKKRFTYILTGILHKRINYPGFNFNDEDKKTNGGDKQSAAKNKHKHPTNQERLPNGSGTTGASGF